MIDIMLNNIDNCGFIFFKTSIRLMRQELTGCDFSTCYWFGMNLEGPKTWFPCRK